MTEKVGDAQRGSRAVANPACRPEVEVRVVGEWSCMEHASGPDEFQKMVTLLGVPQWLCGSGIHPGAHDHMNSPCQGDEIGGKGHSLELWRKMHVY